MAGVGGQVAADCRARTGAIGQCTLVKGWMEVGTAGLVGIMPFELGRRSLGGLRSSRRSTLGRRRSCVVRRASLHFEREEARLGLGPTGARVGGRVQREAGSGGIWRAG